MDMKSYYEDMIGLEIIGFRFERDEHGDDEGWPIFEVKDKQGDKFDLVISCDAEGNGGGFVFVEVVQ